MSDGPGLELVKTQLNALGQKTAELKAKKAEAEDQLKTVEERFKLREESKAKIIAFPALWRKGTPSEQKRLLRTIFKYLLPTTNSLRVLYWLTEDDGSKDN